MVTSAQGRELIVVFEGLLPYAYDDPVGLCTVGVGHLLHRSKCTAADYARYGKRGAPKLSRADALAILSEDLRSSEAAIGKAVRVTLNQHEFDALVSLVFNIGIGSFQTSTVLRRLNAGNRQGAAEAFMLWVKAGGKVLPGLVRRREAERALFLTPLSPVGEGAVEAKAASNERRWIHEYDHLKAHNLNKQRRVVLRRYMTRARKALWRRAQADGWDGYDRRGRWERLRARTR